MAVFPSDAQAQNEMLIRVPMPTPVQDNKQKQQQPVQEQQAQAESQNPIRDVPTQQSPFKQVNDPNNHSIIIPYFEEEVSPQVRMQMLSEIVASIKYETMRAPKKGLINRGQFIGGGQFTPNTPDENVPQNPVPPEPTPTKPTKRQLLIKGLRGALKNKRK
jgi:hypothetical protein